MLTRCPHCQTHFRVTAEQLKIRQGQVRCGACQEVFDALDSLSDEVPAPAPVVPSPPPVMIATETESRRSQDGMGESHVTIVTVESIPAAANEIIAIEPEREAPAEPETPVEEWEAVPAAPAPPRRWPWAAGIVALLLVAAGQLAYIFRTELAVISPELRPALVAGCELVGCTLLRPLKPELVGIETSDLAPEGETLLLTATLKNRAPFEQDFPHLELTLTDTQDEALVRKILLPADYLPAGQDPAQGFAARGEVAIRLVLTTDQVPAVGYRLYLFYP
jgi:predicted Zn finger-like uncharacterized protein